MRPPGNSQAFTLIEILVSIAVLAVFTVIISQIIGASTQQTRSTTRLLDATAQVRFSFDRIGLDLAAKPPANQLPMVVTKNAGNDEIQFYTQIPGYSGDRGASAIHYRIGTLNDRQGLLRGAEGTGWATGGSTVDFQSDTLPDVNADAWEMIGAAVIRMEISHLGSNGLLYAGAPDRFKNPKAIIVTLATISNDAAKLLSSGEVTSIVEGLPDAVDGKDTLAEWNNKWGDKFSTLPPLAAQSLRFHQRYFTLQ